MTLTNQRDMNYRTAVTMNNSGVQLLQNGAYKDAIGVFKRATIVMQQGVLSETCNSDIFDIAETQTYMMSLAQHLAQLTSHHQPTYTASASGVQPVVYSDQYMNKLTDILQSPTDDADMDESKMPRIHPVVMDSVDMADCYLKDITSGIILYNYGLSLYSYYWSNVMTLDPDTENTIIASCTDIFRLAQNILIAASIQCNEANSSHTLLAMCITSLVIDILSQLLMLQNRFDLARNAMATLSQIISMVVQDECFVVLDNQVAAAA